MQIVEITLGAERKRPGPVPYSSDGASAFLKIEVHPTDDVAEVIQRGRDILRATLDVLASQPTSRAGARPIANALIIPR